MQLNTLCALVFGLFCVSAFGKDYGSITSVVVASVYDGDTFRVNIDNWPSVIGENTPVRVKGVDTPELRAKCAAEKQKAKLAKQFTSQLLENSNKVELRNIQRGKYFRLLADVYVDGHNLAELLINAGHGYSYAGGKRRSWCEL
ncbi:thermonuclease family protein [Thalassotalea sp. HSM 43]|uniref:thermonuclease family protein n=1 Tax=Thalassotalea sp. HSM 43 TaxID=2552945 RepID=UPI0010802236|nr:thermonuclease family protein [Thalassotalea sp. HSM 43]QBY04272.1 thermonuclease family protein [Thalassotalea sp. HSM 43]